VYYRDADGRVNVTTRSAFNQLAADGRVSPDTPVFDTAITTASGGAMDFERPMRESWHAQLVSVR
jgi:hypothetical protein